MAGLYFPHPLKLGVDVSHALVMKCEWNKYHVWAEALKASVWITTQSPLHLRNHKLFEIQVCRDEYVSECDKSADRVRNECSEK